MAEQVILDGVNSDPTIAQAFVDLNALLVRLQARIADLEARVKKLGG